MQPKGYSKLSGDGDELEIEQDITEKENEKDGHNNKCMGTTTSTLGRWPTLEKAVSKVLIPMGFEAHPFQVGWYNELVGPRFHLNYPENTVALVVISGPDTFEKCIIPFVKSHYDSLELRKFDVLDGSMKHVFNAFSEELSEQAFDVDAIHDFEMHPSRKPKVLVQTASHVAGAAEYFHKDRVNNNLPNWLKDSKLFGVAIHPAHGGWFAIRGVVILKNLILDEGSLLVRPPCPLPQIDESIIRQLLEEFGINWKTHVWRDLLPRSSKSKYSQYFIDYLSTEPDNRWNFIKSLPFFQEESQKTMSLSEATEH